MKSWENLLKVWCVVHENRMRSLIDIKGPSFIVSKLANLNITHYKLVKG